MARFTTRIELLRAADGDYEVLHKEMEDRGFTRTIVADNGTVYRLPTAEYNFEGSSTSEEVRDAARAAAQATGRKSWVLVTESVGRTWYLPSEA